MTHVPVASLDAMAHTLAAAKELSYDWMEIAAGQRVLDVGCGPATDTLALARRVAAEGRVDGVDADPEMVAEAERRADDAGLGETVHHAEADALDLPFADDEFDAARSERLFQHLADPAAALAEMVRVTRPGGRVVVLDTDHALTFIDSDEPELAERLLKLRAGAVENPRSGRRLWRLTKEAGLTDVAYRVIPMVFTDLGEALASTDLTKAAGAAVQRGAVSGEEAMRLQTSLAAAQEAGTFFGGGFLVLVAGTVPG